MHRRAWIKADCIRAIAGEADNKAPLETGGVLLGYWNNTDVVIEEVVGPGIRAHHGQFEFIPDSEWQYEKISRIYRQSGYKCTYLGDWHTHPLGGDGLSSKDISTLRRISHYRKARAVNPIMAVISKAGDWKLTLCCYHRRGQFRPRIILISEIYVY